MIPYRPLDPQTLRPRKGWRSEPAAVVVSALLGTTATSAVAAEPEASVTQAAQAAQATSSGDSVLT